jgi:hypothetical protein
MYHTRKAMQYEPAKTVLRSPPAGLSFWAVLFEAGGLLIIAYALAQLVGG